MYIILDMEISDETVDEIIDTAGLLKQAPEEPKGGIPSPWLPEFFRKLVQLACYPVVLLDLTAQSIAKLFIRPPFRRVGSCKRRGNCCYYIVLKRTRGPLGFLERFWATQINGFYYRNKKPVSYMGKSVHLMGCRYLKKDGSCGNYTLRPMICRTWPVIAYFGWPRILKGCGYQVRATKAYQKMQKRQHQHRQPLHEQEN
jgi:Fe-S-cluster containining protein